MSGIISSFIFKSHFHPLNNNKKCVVHGIPGQEVQADSFPPSFLLVLVKFDWFQRQKSSAWDRFLSCLFLSWKTWIKLWFIDIFVLDYPISSFFLLYTNLWIDFVKKILIITERINPYIISTHNFIILSILLYVVRLCPYTSFLIVR
jgi:hypothetical protein